MKKILIVFAICLVGFTSCKKEKKESKTEPETTEITEKFVVKPEATSVSWTAYKTTAKKGVGGKFNTVNFDSKEGTSVEDALNNLNFSIPISSLFTKDVGRDAKIKEFFFGKMLDTEILKGTIKFDGTNYFAELVMNGVTNNLPLEVAVTDERRVTMAGTINLNEWKALEALASFNKIC